MKRTHGFSAFHKESSEDGEKEYEAPESFHARLDRELEIRMRGDQVTVLLDGKEAAHVEAPEMTGREVGLWSGWNSQAWSQRNLADDVYDGRNGSPSSDGS